jgi:hypothetical protein
MDKQLFFDQESVGRRGKLSAMPLQQLAAQNLREYGGSVLRQADVAARLDKPDWQILLKLKTDGIGLLLPDLQQLRTLASALQVRFRAELAVGRFDDAVRTAKTLFAMARHLGEHPTLIGQLVGIAVAQVAIVPLEEMLEQPGCPNLYWALTNLPTPLISFEMGLEGERASLRGEFRDLDDRAPMSQDQLKKLIAHLDALRKDDKLNPGVRVWLNARTKDGGAISAARRRLIEVGHAEELLLRFPAEQVMLLDQWRDYEVRRDDLMKLMNLPYWQMEALGGLDYKRPKEPSLFADLLVPALHKVRRAQGRLEQRVALLRHVEALRLYAADHGGKLPEKLSDVPVPLPDDPFIGKPFSYKVDGATAHLRGSPPRGEETNAIFNVRYEVTIQK